MNINRPLLKRLRPYPFSITIIIVFCLFSILLLVLQVSTLSSIIARVFMEHEPLNKVAFLMLVFLLYALLRLIVLRWGKCRVDETALAIKREIKTDVLAQLDQTAPDQLASYKEGELLHVMTTGADKVESYFSQYVPQLLYALLIPFLLISTIFFFDIQSGIILFFTVPLIPLFMVLIGQQSQHRIDKQWRVYSQMSGFFLDVLRGLPTLKLLGQSKKYAEKVAEVTDAFRKRTLEVLKVAFLSSFSLELISMLSIAVIAVSTGIRLLHGNMDFQTALFILILVPDVYLPLRKLGSSFHVGQEALTAWKEVSALLKPLSVNQGVALVDGDGTITVDFKKVCFHYEKQQALIADLSFSFSTGTITVIRGYSGIGKSTIFKLLLGFYPPDSGTIEINHINSVALDRSHLFRSISWIPQKPFLFNDTIKYNICLSNPDADMQQIKRATECANMASLIDTLPEQYDTRIGENGNRLSGGQKQRIALARTFLNDAPILLLDEPTSSLDAVSRTHLLNTLREQAKTKAVLIISHSKEIMEIADHIVEL